MAGARPVLSQHGTPGDLGGWPGTIPTSPARHLLLFIKPLKQTLEEWLAGMRTGQRWDAPLDAPWASCQEPAWLQLSAKAASGLFLTITSSNSWLKHPGSNTGGVLLRYGDAGTDFPSSVASSWRYDFMAFMAGQKLLKRPRQLCGNLRSPVSHASGCEPCPQVPPASGMGGPNVKPGWTLHGLRDGDVPGSVRDCWVQLLGRADVLGHA